ncbi:MAG: LysR family transcriptional regulator [Candidatus Kapaibacterium sp.]
MNANITLQQLIYAVAVDGRGSFVDAAEECKVSQPALSMQIRKLENTLGVALFDRSRQPVQPTEIGRRVIAQARLVLREAGRVQELIDLAQGEMKGEYRLGVLPSIASWVLPGAVREFTDRHPEVMMTVREFSIEEIVDGLKRDRLDGAIVPLPLGVETFVERTLYHEPLIAYVPRRHRLYDYRRIESGNLYRSDLLLPAKGDPLRGVIAELVRNENGLPDERESFRWEGGSFDSLRRLAEEGLGIALLPKFLADEIRGSGTADMLREFAAPIPHRTIGLICTSSHTKGHITDEFEATLLSRIPPGLLEKPV